MCNGVGWRCCPSTPTSIKTLQLPDVGLLCCDLPWGQSRGSHTCPSSTEPRPHSSTGSRPPGTRSGRAHDGTSGGSSRTCSCFAAARSTLQGQPGHTPAPALRGSTAGTAPAPFPGCSSGSITVSSSCPAVCLSLCAMSRVLSALLLHPYIICIFPSVRAVSCVLMSLYLSQCPCCVSYVCPPVQAVYLSHVPMSMLCSCQCPTSLCPSVLSLCPCCYCQDQCPCVLACALCLSRCPYPHAFAPRPGVPIPMSPSPRRCSTPTGRGRDTRGGSRPADTSDEGDGRVEDIVEGGLEVVGWVGHRRSPLGDGGAGRRYLVRLPVVILRHRGGGGERWR